MNFPFPVFKAELIDHERLITFLLYPNHSGSSISTYSQRQLFEGSSGRGEAWGGDHWQGCGGLAQTLQLTQAPCLILLREICVPAKPRAPSPLATAAAEHCLETPTTSSMKKDVLRRGEGRKL